MDFIRITALQDIGNNIAYSSLVPVVDMAGTPTTKKANLQIVANLVLSGAGGTYFAPAARAILAQSVTNAAQPNITSVGTLTSLAVSGNVNLGSVSNVRITGGSAGQVLSTNGNGVLSWTNDANSSYGNGNVANYLPTFTGTVGANTIRSTASSGSNVQINANGAIFTFGQGGALFWPSGGNVWAIEPNSDNEFEIKSTSNVVISTDINNANAHFTFASDGAVYCPSNAFFEGTRLNVGPGAGNVPLATNPTLVVTDTGLEFIQAALINQSPNGSSDYAAYGADSDETQGFSDLGFAGHDFDDPNYTITAPGDGYVLSQGYANGIGGGLVLATGENGNVPDIVFATGGFLANAEFARIDHSANVFHLTRANSGIRFPNGTTQRTAATGNIITVNLDGNSSNVLRGNGTWGPDANSSYGNSNVTSLLASFGSNTITTTGNVSVGNISATNLGNIATINLTGSNANVLYGNGVFAPASGGGGGSELVNGNNSFVLDSAGNVVFEGTPSGNAVDRGLVWDYGANANGVNSMIRQDLNGLTVRAWTEDSGNYTAPVNIITGQDANAKTWTFDGQGNLTVPSGSINSIDSVGDLGAYITLNPDLGLAKLAGRNALSNVGYTNTSWSTATYTGTQINFTNAPDLVTFFNDNQFNVGVNQTFSINGDEPVPFTGYSTGSSNAVTVYTSVTADPDPTTVTSIDFYYQLESYVAVDYDAGTLNINATGLTINLDNDQTSGPDINLRSGDDITLQGKDKSLGSESEGGDINIYGGDGGDDDGLGNNSASGGDIQIEGGIGGSGNTGSGSSGGFARFQGGAGGDAGVGTVAGSGGYVQINAGDGGYNGGNAQLGSQGGYVEIYAGQTTLADGVGGYVEISSGTAADGNGMAGNVVIRTPISATGQGGNWTFDGEGNLTLPNGNPYIKTSDEESTITISVSGAANNRSQFQIGSDGGTDQFTYISSQNDTNGIASFGLNAPNGVPTSAVIGINNGTALDWTFSSAPLDDTEAYLYMPAGTTVTTPNAPSGQTGKNIFIEAGSVDQENYNTNTGGELMLKGGRGGFNDGGGGGPGGNVNINAGESADPAGHAGNVNITAGALTNWTFDYTGNLTLPGNSFAVNYANGSQVVLGSAALGNLTVDDVTLQGDNNSLNLSAGSDFTANLQYLQVRAGDVASHIHFDTGNNEAYDQYFGNDSKFVKLGLGIAGNVSIGTYQDGGVGQLEWIFDSNGNLVLAGGESVIQSIPNSSLDPLNPNVSTMVLTPDASYSSQALVLDPTSVGHIHLRSPSASSNIDDPSANLFLGGEASSFEVGIGYGSAPNVYVHSNNNTWTFGTDGNLTIPGTSGGFIKTISNASIGIAAMDNGTNNPAQLLSMNVGNGNATSIVSAYSTNVAIQTNAAGAINTWAFDSAGNLTLPGNTFAVNYANGTQVSLGGGYGDSNVVSLLSSFGSNTISTTGNISTGAVTASGKIGYSAGGTVTQSGVGQGVTLNQLTGQITLAKSSWTAGDLEVFILTNNKVSANDYVLAQTIDSVNAPSFNVNAYYYSPIANSIYVQVKALETVTSTPVVKFFIMKAPIS